MVTPPMLLGPHPIRTRRFIPTEPTYLQLFQIAFENTSGFTKEVQQPLGLCSISAPCLHPRDRTLLGSNDAPPVQHMALCLVPLAFHQSIRFFRGEMRHSADALRCWFQLEREYRRRPVSALEVSQAPKPMRLISATGD
jgi:hypothetical protein